MVNTGLASIEKMLLTLGIWTVLQTHYRAGSKTTQYSYTISALTNIW